MTHRPPSKFADKVNYLAAYMYYDFASLLCPSIPHDRFDSINILNSGIQRVIYKLFTTSILNLLQLAIAAMTAMRVPFDAVSGYNKEPRTETMWIK